MLFRKRVNQPAPDDAGEIIGVMFRYGEAAANRIRELTVAVENLTADRERLRRTSEIRSAIDESLAAQCHRLESENAALRAKLAPFERTRDPKNGKIIGSAKP